MAARPRLFPEFPDRDYPPLGIRAAQVAAVSATVAALLSVAGWIVPAIIDDLAVPVMIVGFTIALIGMAGVIFTAWSNRLDARGESRTRWEFMGRRWREVPRLVRRFPKWLGLMLAVICAVAAVSTALSLRDTGGFSQNPANYLPRCPWSIGTNHGFTEICVSHSRWLATGYEFQRSFLAAIAIFLSIECAIYTYESIRQWDTSDL